MNNFYKALNVHVQLFAHVFIIDLDLSQIIVSEPFFLK